MNKPYNTQFLCDHDTLSTSIPDTQESIEPSELTEPQTSSETEVDTPQPEMLPMVATKISLRTELSNSLRSKIRTLRTIALWPFRKIGSELGVPLTTVYTICQQPSTPSRPRTGRPRVLTALICQKLIDHATLSQENRRKPLIQIAQEIGIIVVVFSSHILR